MYSFQRFGKWHQDSKDYQKNRGTQLEKNKNLNLKVEKGKKERRHERVKEIMEIPLKVKNIKDQIKATSESNLILCRNRLK